MSIYDQEAPEGKFIRFKHGTVARVRLFGEPIGFEKSFQGQEPKQRFASLCILRNKERKANELKVLEFGWEIQKRLKAFVKDADWGSPHEFDVEITATNDGLDREYQVVPKPKAPLTDAEKALIKSCDWDLAEITKPKDPAPADNGYRADPPAATDEYNPFADE